MFRRIVLIGCIVSLVVLGLIFSINNTKAQSATPTRTPTTLPTSTAYPGAEFTGTPLSGAAPLTVQFTHLNANRISGCLWTFGDGSTLSAPPASSQTSSVCPSVSHTYTAAGNYTVSLRVTKATNSFSSTITKTNYIQVSGSIPTATYTPTATTGVPGQPDLSFPSLPYWMWDPGSYDSTNNCYNSVPVLVWNVQVKNTGSSDAGSFTVGQNYDAQRIVSGLPAGQTSTLYFPFPGRPFATAAPGQPTLSASYSNFAADTTNTVVESNETNNTTRQAIPVFTPTLYSGATRVFCRTSTPTPTPTGPTPTFTRTPTATPTCPCISPSPTRTPTRTLTPTITLTAPTGGTCSPVNATITAPFTWDGAGTFCWQSSNLGTYINNWSNTSVTLNGVNITNMYVAAGSYPAKIGGFWYVTFNSAVAWGHFEAK